MKNINSLTEEKRILQQNLDTLQLDKTELHKEKCKVGGYLMSFFYFKNKLFKPFVDCSSDDF